MRVDASAKSRTSPRDTRAWACAVDDDDDDDAVCVSESDDQIRIVRCARRHRRRRRHGGVHRARDVGSVVFAHVCADARRIARRSRGVARDACDATPGHHPRARLVAR